MVGLVRGCKNTSTKRLAYYAAWTYWVVHIPYLAQKPQAILIALGWAVQGNGNLVNTMPIVTVSFISLIIFLVFLLLSTKGLTTLKSYWWFSWNRHVCDVYFIHSISGRRTIY